MEKSGEESGLQLPKLPNKERSDSNEISASGVRSLLSPSSQLSRLRLSGSGSDEIEGLTPLSPRHRLFSPANNIHCESEANINCDPTRREELAIIKCSSEEQATAEKSLKTSKIKSPSCPEHKDSQQSNGEQMPLLTPPTSHLAMRRKLNRRAQLPDGTREESENAAEPSTHRPLCSRPKSPQINVCCSVPLESLRKSRESATRKTKQPSLDRNLPPRSPTVNRFLYPEALRVSRRSTRDTSTRTVSGTSREIPPKGKSAPKKHPATPRVRQSSSSRLQNVHQPGQRNESCYRVGSSCLSSEAWAAMLQGPPSSPTSSTARRCKLFGQRGPCILGKVLVGKTKDGRLFVLPAIPVEHLRNTGFFLVPDSTEKKDLERTCSALHPPSGKSCVLPPLPRAQKKRTVSPGTLGGQVGRTWLHRLLAKELEIICFK